MNKEVYIYDQEDLIQSYSCFSLKNGIERTEEYNIDGNKLIKIISNKVRDNPKDVEKTVLHFEHDDISLLPIDTKFGKCVRVYEISSPNSFKMPNVLKTEGSINGMPLHFDIKNDLLDKWLKILRF